MRISPFSNGDASSIFNGSLKDVIQEIQSLDNSYVLQASQVELEDSYIDKLIIQPLIFHVDRQYIENQESIRMDVSHEFDRAVRPGARALVPGTRLDIAIPYEGDPKLWQLSPSSFSLSGYPKIEVQSDVIVIFVSFPDDSVRTENIKSEIDRKVSSLEKAVQTLNAAIDNHNSSVPGAVKGAIQRKRELAKSTIAAVSELGIPIKRLDEPLTFVAPIKRHKSPVAQPSVAGEDYKQEPVLEEAEYQHILKVMSSMSLVIERSPTVFATLDEEAIRTHFLIQLNGHYEGSATGETFNASGKTDILIRAGGRNIFIAECKFWGGKKAFNEAIDQLLGYLSWRDTKCALLVFNRRKDSTAVRQKMHEVMEARPEHRRTNKHDLTDDSMYTLVKDSDSGREIFITTQLYDIPIEK